MKKAGGATPFNLFVLAEVDCMSRLLTTVRETLQVGKISHTDLSKIECSLTNHSSYYNYYQLVLTDHQEYH